MKRILTVAVLLTSILLSCAASPPKAAARLEPTADLVIVEKSQRKMHLVSNGHVFRSYDISLGNNPLGHKRYKGDGRTPEGRYYLDWRNPQSRFHKSIRISYPNDTDRQRAQHLGRAPGGNIMIHGIPNRYRRAPELFEGLDWTEGCIAVRNEDMEEIWQLVADHTPIEIYP